ncbi:unnamed protein product [Diabrotica balteata]|uniref:Uncharacterized protein n=1 Tax=Diabrotica balteata TaxID=107213 RepID=A0A9N9T889_DIABA|nr:unnamed protein product [Diabrotica balteata]
MHLDRRLTWKKHIFTKRQQLGLKLSKIYWFIGKRSQLNLYNKILVSNGGKGNKNNQYFNHID